MDIVRPTPQTLGRPVVLKVESPAKQVLSGDAFIASLERRIGRELHPAAKALARWPWEVGERWMLEDD